MKAWILEKQAPIKEKPLKLVEIPEPRVREKEIKIKVIATGICRTDLHIAEGELRLKKSPVVLGHEIVGEVVETGSGVRRFKKGSQVGVTWLNRSCRQCRFCREGKENYCPHFTATGWDVDGGFAEYMVVDEDYALDIGGLDLSPEYIAPMMCPGVTSQAVFNLADVKDESNLGIYGYGPTAYYLLKLAIKRNIKVYISTRSRMHQKNAIDEGAFWVGNAIECGMPEMMDSIVFFPPAGEIMEDALKYLIPGGNFVLSPVFMTPMTIQNYHNNLWGKTIKTLYNVNMKDSRQFIETAKNIKPRIQVDIFSFEELQDAMILLKEGKLKSMNAVVIV